MHGEFWFAMPKGPCIINLVTMECSSGNMLLLHIQLSHNQLLILGQLLVVDQGQGGMNLCPPTSAADTLEMNRVFFHCSHLHFVFCTIHELLQHLGLHIKSIALMQCILVSWKPWSVSLQPVNANLLPVGAVGSASTNSSDDWQVRNVGVKWKFKCVWFGSGDISLVFKTELQWSFVSINIIFVLFVLYVIFYLENTVLWNRKLYFHALLLLFSYYILTPGRRHYGKWTFATNKFHLIDILPNIHQFFNISYGITWLIYIELNKYFDDHFDLDITCILLSTVDLCVKSYTNYKLIC